MWRTLEELGVLPEGEMESLFSTLEAREALYSLVHRRLVFRNPLTGDFRSLSSLMRDLA